MTDTPSSVPPAPGPASTGPLTLHGQYIKDMSFENPRAPQSLIEQKQPRRSRRRHGQLPASSA